MYNLYTSEFRCDEAPTEHEKTRNNMYNGRKFHLLTIRRTISIIYSGMKSKSIIVQGLQIKTV